MIGGCSGMIETHGGVLVVYCCLEMWLQCLLSCTAKVLEVITWPRKGPVHRPNLVSRHGLSSSTTFRILKANDCSPRMLGFSGHSN